jgi:phosphate transport system substrate-binding protein
LPSAEGDSDLLPIGRWRYAVNSGAIKKATVVRLLLVNGDIREIVASDVPKLRAYLEDLEPGPLDAPSDEERPAERGAAGPEAPGPDSQRQPLGVMGRLRRFLPAQRSSPRQTAPAPSPLIFDSPSPTPTGFASRAEAPVLVGAATGLMDAPPIEPADVIAGEGHIADGSVPLVVDRVREPTEAFFADRPVDDGREAMVFDPPEAAPAAPGEPFVEPDTALPPEAADGGREDSPERDIAHREHATPVSPSVLHAPPSPDWLSSLVSTDFATPEARARRAGAIGRIRQRMHSHAAARSPDLEGPEPAAGSGAASPAAPTPVALGDAPPPPAQPRAADPAAEEPVFRGAEAAGIEVARHLEISGEPSDAPIPDPLQTPAIEAGQPAPLAEPAWAESSGPDAPEETSEEGVVSDVSDLAEPIAALPMAVEATTQAVTGDDASFGETGELPLFAGDPAQRAIPSAADAIATPIGEPDAREQAAHAESSAPTLSTKEMSSWPILTVAVEPVGDELAPSPVPAQGASFVLGPPAVRAPDGESGEPASPDALDALAEPPGRTPTPDGVEARVVPEGHPRPDRVLERMRRREAWRRVMGRPRREPPTPTSDVPAPQIPTVTTPVVAAPDANAIGPEALEAAAPAPMIPAPGPDEAERAPVAGFAEVAADQGEGAPALETSASQVSEETPLPTTPPGGLVLTGTPSPEGPAESAPPLAPPATQGLDDAPSLVTGAGEPARSGPPLPDVPAGAPREIAEPRVAAIVSAAPDIVGSAPVAATLRSQAPDEALPPAVSSAEPVLSGPPAPARASVPIDGAMAPGPVEPPGGPPPAGAQPSPSDTHPAPPDVEALADAGRDFTLVAPPADHAGVTTLLDASALAVAPDRTLRETWTPTPPADLVATAPGPADAARPLEAASRGASTQPAGAPPFVDDPLIQTPPSGATASFDPQSPPPILVDEFSERLRALLTTVAEEQATATSIVAGPLGDSPGPATSPDPPPAEESAPIHSEDATATHSVEEPAQPDVADLSPPVTVGERETAEVPVIDPDPDPTHTFEAWPALSDEPPNPAIDEGAVMERTAPDAIDPSPEPPPILADGPVEPPPTAPSPAAELSLFPTPVTERPRGAIDRLRETLRSKESLDRLRELLSPGARKKSPRPQPELAIPDPIPEPSGPAPGTNEWLRERLYAPIDPEPLYKKLQEGRVEKQGGSAWTLVAVGGAVMLTVFAAGYFLTQRPRTIPPPDHYLLTLSGSDALGASLAPQLVQGWLTSKGGTDVATYLLSDRKGDLVPDGQTVFARLDGHDVQVLVNGHGAATGFRDLERGEADIAMASRRVGPGEARALSNLGDMRSPRSEHLLALGGVAVVVPQGNLVANLSRRQLQQIFGCQITSWSQIQGAHAMAGPIHVYAPPNTSSALETLEAYAATGAPSCAVKRPRSDDDMDTAVAGDPMGVGLVAGTYAKARAVPVSDGPGRGVAPTPVAIEAGKYPLSQHLYLYAAAHPPNAAAREFLQYALSASGQAIVRDLGAVAVGKPVRPGRRHGHAAANSSAD